MTTEWAVPWRPHCLVTYALELPDDFRNYNQSRTFPALPDRPNPGFRPWTTYVTQVEEVQLYDTMPNQPAKHLADWVSVTEQYLLQQHPWAPQGRASNLQAEYKPLTSPKAGPIWKKGKPAFWEQLQARLSLIQHQAHPSPGTIQGFLKATESTPKHWIGEPAWAQFLDMIQHWNHHKDPRTLELMQHTIQHQLTQALEQSRTEGQLQYAAWIRQGEAKGLRGLFRNLKASELAWQRPYRTVPMADRMRHRLHDWHQHWQPTADNQALARDSLQDSAQKQAAQLPPLTIGHLARVLKQLPDRACGPDAISTQLLRNTPPQALRSLLQLLQDMEKSATMPTQLQMSLVVMLAKNEKVERPITLTSVLYRTWCRLRKSMLDSWQLNLPSSMDYDRARPGATALHVALDRLLRQESNKTLAQHGITVLLDMSTFYDTIDLKKLQTVAQAHDYPPLALEFAMQVYTGPKAVLADAELSHWFHVTHGVAAGCPQAPLLAKAFLQPILSPFQAKHPDLHLNGWVDDIGFDGNHHNPDTLATRIVTAWHELRSQLTDAGLKVNNHKTAFIVTDRATHRALAKLLGPDDPPIQSVMRDLGIDHQAGRRRRITTLQHRFKKNRWQVEELLQAEAKQQRQHRFASRRNCQALVSGIDWTTASKATKSLSKAQATHIRTWNQAAIRFKDGTSTKLCPICQVPATPKHIIWMCKWHHNQKHAPLPAPWTERLQDPLEEPLWAYGWIPKEPQDHLHCPLGLAGHGCWQSLEPLPLQPWQGLSVTIDATPTSGDKRAQAWIYALCIHGYSLGALQRKGIISGMARGPQTKARAIFQGLLTLAQFIQTPTRVIVQVSSVWEAWINPAKRKGFHDLVQGQAAEYFTLITPLYIHKNHKTPDAPGNEPHLRQRQRDAALEHPQPRERSLAARPRPRSPGDLHTCGRQTGQNLRRQGALSAHQTGQSNSPQDQAKEKDPHRSVSAALATGQASVEGPPQRLPMPHLPNQGPPGLAGIHDRRKAPRGLCTTHSTNT